MEEKEPDILEMLIRHELALNQLYEVFAVKFPSCQEFWQTIAGDEQRHSALLENLWSEKTLENWLLFERRLKSQAIEFSIGYVETQIARARKGNFNLLGALSISNDLERALIEKQFSKIGDPVCGEVRSILMELATDTERHRKVIAEALDAKRRQKQ